MDPAVSQLLGGEDVLGPCVSSNLDLARATREGLPTRAAVELASEILEYEPNIESSQRDEMLWTVREMRDLAEQESHPSATRIGWDIARIAVSSRMAATLNAAMGPLGVLVGTLFDALATQQTRTVHWSHLRPRLTPAESDIVVRTATALARATEVLGDKKKAVHWLSSPNRALGGEVPISLLDTSAGEHEVQSVLERIEYGVYS